MLVDQFHAALHQAGFAFLKHAGRFVDQHHRIPHHFLLPVTDARGRTMRRETLAALKSWRAKHEAGGKAKVQIEQRQIALASVIAPRALPPCRSDLTGPEAVAQLADDFLLATTSSEGVSFKSLINKGWRGVQLREYGDAARALADRRSVITASSQPVQGK